MKNAYKCKPGYRQTKQPWGGGVGGWGIRQGKRRQILSKDNLLPKQEPNKKNKQHRTVKAGTIRE